MDELIEKYKRDRKQRKMLLADLWAGIIFIIYTIIYCCTPLVNNVWIYIITLTIFYMMSLFIKYWIKLYSIYELKEKLNWKKLSIYSINCLYDEKINNTNKKIVEDILKDMTSQQIDSFYKYLCNTRSNIEFFKLRDIILMGLSFVIGASFDDKAIISINLLSNALNSVIGCFLGLLPFYLIFTKISFSYTKLSDGNIINSELIGYIDKIKYDNAE